MEEPIAPSCVSRNEIEDGFQPDTASLKALISCWSLGFMGRAFFWFSCKRAHRSQSLAFRAASILGSASKFPEHSCLPALQREVSLPSVASDSDMT